MTAAGSAAADRCAAQQCAQPPPMQPSPAQPSGQQHPPTPDAARTGFAPYASPTPSPRAAPTHVSTCDAQLATHGHAAGGGGLPTHRSPGTAAAGIPACVPERDQLLRIALALARCVAGSPVLQAALVGLEAAGGHPQVAAGAAAPTGLEWSLAQAAALLARAGDVQGALRAAVGCWPLLLACLLLLRGRSCPWQTERQTVATDCGARHHLPPISPVPQSTRARC